MIRLVLKSGRETSIRRRHPWLFSGAIARTEGDGSDGLARVVSASGEPLASGVYSPESAIVARLWSFESDGESELGVGSSRVDLQACKLEYSIVSPK